ncbi:protein FAM133 [Ananas comosus]|uniref:Protein FAM133 n=2 Tax=Ananas comosus TaxID=4615 RepID=A0A6P5GWZ1_ANACO|nr:protein FAM133 [Ananas comosus]XP_020112318.1 protein FAM133 [Ananas comosus]XP_020112319.1 protein FAM133 [Ananas comosus]
MDLETENRLAALLMEEARRLRLQAEQEGVHVYLRQPNVRARPNSRFLTATVLGVQQANRAVEVGEMWRAREKELELEGKLKDSHKDRSISRGEKRRSDSLHRSSSSRVGQKRRNSASSCSSSKLDPGNGYSDEDAGLRDEDIEAFLQSRAKRGRGAIGSRMDETGPYVASLSNHNNDLSPPPEVRVKEEWERRVLGPEKPAFVKSESTEEPSDMSDMADDASHPKRHKSKDERKKAKSSEKTKRKEKKSKHRHHHRHHRRHHHRSRSRE